MFEQEQKTIELHIQSYCAENGIPVPASMLWNPIPFSGEWGITTTFFQLAAQEARTGKKINVAQRAQEMAAGVAQTLGTPVGFTRVEAIKGYLNLYFSPAVFTRRVVQAVLEQGQRYGSGASTGQRVMVEFSQPNTHKAFHVGHLRSAILGDALARILEFAGYQVVRANYPGDMGLHVIKWLWNYLKNHNGEEPTADITQWMGDIYIEATRLLEATPELEAEVRAVYARWDQRDPQVVAIWEKTRQWSLEGFNQMYAALDIRFERYYFNSEEEQPGKEMVAALVQRGIAIDERPDGPVIVRIDDLLGLKVEKYRVLVVLRSDGTALYATEDLALVLHKFADYPDLVRSIYVVDVRQSLHFTQVFKTLEIAGYEIAQKCVHVPYELVTLPGNVVLSSREGTVVLLEDLLREATRRALAVVRQKNPNLSEAQMLEVARAVGIGALKYPMLARENTKLVTFDWQTALDFNGQAAPYIQYAHVRANSILRKSQTEEVDDENSPAFQSPILPLHPLDPTEIQLIDLIARFPAEVQRAAQEFKPLVITSLAYEVARAFNDFYGACPVLQAEPHVRTARLQLVAAARQALANMLSLLGIIAPEVM